MWFIYAFLCIIFWGLADLFYKKGADDLKKYTHIKTAIMVGFVMGIHALYLLVFKTTNYAPINLLIYLPVSAMYILSMILGYFGLRYLYLSIVSPIQNSSGAIVCLLCILFLGQSLNFISGIAVFLICLGIFLLGVFEKKENKKNRFSKCAKSLHNYCTIPERFTLLYRNNPMWCKNKSPFFESNKKYKIGFIAFLMPIFYCILDAAGTFFDAFYLDDISTTPLINVTESTLENVASISYELTFFIVGLILLIFLKIFKKEKLDLSTIKVTGFAAIFETIGQSLYVFAMSEAAVVAAPLVSSYSIISLILSRIFLKERLNKKQYFSISIVFLGIILLGIFNNT